MKTIFNKLGYEYNAHAYNDRYIVCLKHISKELLSIIEFNKITKEIRLYETEFDGVQTTCKPFNIDNPLIIQAILQQMQKL